MHIPVLEKEALAGLVLKPGMTVVDATLGEGGHSLKIAEAIGVTGRLVAIDRDRDSIDRAKIRLAGMQCRIEYVEDSFANLAAILDRLGVSSIDAILFDLGWNTGQFEQSGRGFSFAKDEPLLMTFNAPFSASFSADDLTAYKIVNSWSETDIANAIYEYGEERASRRIAKNIIAARKAKPVATSSDLAAIIEKAVGMHGRIHPATKTFQALRIAVNDELGALMKGLEHAIEALTPGGRLAVISFHSLEDRIVKQFMRQHEDAGRLTRITKKPIAASRAEVHANPRARSAKLRIAEKI